MNRVLKISIGKSRKEINWAQAEMTFTEFADRLKNPIRTTESLSEYLALPKSKQDSLKDVGGFVGGSLDGGRRKANNVTGRDLITLDLDNIPAGKTEEVVTSVKALSVSYAVYSTRKHSDRAPRLRVILPLDRTVTADEYEPIARKVCSMINIAYADSTTFEASRLMYWPSCSSDSDYICDIDASSPCISADSILKTYDNWRNVASWPQVPGVEAVEKRALAKQQDPTTKEGIVGAFCKTYNVESAMDAFIPGLYDRCDIPGRFTFTGGTTTGGAVLYDGGNFLYSHHATDPTSGELVNAFDLVRIHKFEDLDSEARAGTPAGRLPSFTAMAELARSDKKVATLLAQERRERAKELFGTDDAPALTTDAPEEDLNWASLLKINKDGSIAKTIDNIVIILENDPDFKGKIVVDEFASCGLVLSALPWDKEDERRRWTDVDDANLYNYMETVYGITGTVKIDQALIIVSNRHKINEVKDYLKSLKWDGVKRVDTLLHDYLGAEQNIYTAAVMRKFLCAAVTRAVRGATKFDNMPILIGGQGIGKSTFAANLGKEWFSDSLTTFEGKEAAEMIQGVWINEVGELTAMTRQESEAVKQFLSKKEDIYRAAYGRRTMKYPRRCVFIGTSNKFEVLKDQTGNRRFWPVEVDEVAPTKSVWKDMPAVVDQIWAEAYTLFMIGESLCLDKDEERVAIEQQEIHRMASDREGMIRDYMDMKIPSNWESMTIAQRKVYLSTGKAENPIGLVTRRKICAAEIWVELFNGDLRYMKRADSMEINDIISNTPGWKRKKSPIKFGPYGSQRGFGRM